MEIEETDCEYVKLNGPTTSEEIKWWTFFFRNGAKFPDFVKSLESELVMLKFAPWCGSPSWKD
jgi:hypothetical protein